MTLLIPFGDSVREMDMNVNYRLQPPVTPEYWMGNR